MLFEPHEGQNAARGGGRAAREVSWPPFLHIWAAKLVADGFPSTVCDLQ